MDTTMLQRLREGIRQRRQELTDWLSRSSPEERHTRTGPPGEAGIQAHLNILDNTLHKSEENTLGICDVCQGFVEESLLEMDYTASVCLEHFTGEERTRLENDLELSVKVQRALLPHEVPEVRGLDIAAFSRPAGIVGGDYFDFVRMANGSPAFVIADVMGKGMAASLLMASLQASLKIIAPETLEPSNVVARLNQLFCHNIRLTKFVTFFIARYDEDTRLLTYCNAGHNPPLVYSRDGTRRQLMPTGAAIGLVEQFEFSQSSITLRPGDRLLLYTDGVVESSNEEKALFGMERLECYLAESEQLSAKELIAELKTRLQQFSGSTPPADDTTILAICVGP